MIQRNNSILKMASEKYNKVKIIIISMTQLFKSELSYIKRYSKIDIYKKYNILIFNWQ